MAQRYDIVRIDFQANAGHANAAIESLRKTADDCNTKIQKLKKTLKEQIDNKATDKEIQNTRALIAEQQKLYKVYDNGYKNLIKGMRTVDQAQKHFNDGTLAEQSAAFQKAAYNAAKLVRERTPKKEELDKWRQLTALMDATQQNYARLQGDTKMVLETLRKGGKVSVSALNEELKAQRELLSVLSETDKGYKQTQRNVAELDLYLKKMGGNYTFIRQNITDTKKVSDDMLRAMYSGLEQVNQEGKVTQKIIQDNAVAMREIRAEQARRVESVLGGNLGKQSEQNIRAQITVAKELLSTYKTNSQEAQTLSAQIVNAEEHLRTHGVEAARAAQREAQQIKTQEEAEKQLQATMNKRLTSLKTLSADALAETRKYWEAQRNGAAEGTAAFKKAEAALKSIGNVERTRKVTQLDAILGDPKKFGIAEVRNATQEMERLRDSVQRGIPEWQHYNKMVEQGKAYLDNLAKTEAATKISSQMQNLTSLSAQGLAEVKKYWETMVAGAEYGSAELATYETRLKEVTEEEKRRMELQAQSKVSILSGNLGKYSEPEIRKAIEAGMQLIQTYKTADPEAQKLAQNIVAAEQHLKQYGVEAVRSAEREKEALAKATKQRQETMQLMEQQLQRNTGLSQSALQAQEQYWQRLIDDPKAAANELAHYYEQLNKVHAIQKEQAGTQVKVGGLNALHFFRGDTSDASADMVKQQSEALKKYRDSLPREKEAKLIQEINGYLVQTGQNAQRAAEQTMPLKDALKIGIGAEKGTFRGTTDQLNQAKKALESYLQTVKRGGREYNKIQHAIEGINHELQSTGSFSKAVNETLNHPKGKSFNELKTAVEQGRKALANMRTDTNEGRKAFDDLAKKVKECDIQMKTLGGTSKGTASAFDKAWSRLKTYIGLYVGAAVAMQKIVATMGDIMELSDKMGEVRKTTDFTTEEVGRLSAALAKIDTRTTLTGLMELSAVAGQLGLKTEQDVRGFTEAANMLMVALPEMGKEGATAMLKVALATGEIDKIRQQLQDGLVEGTDAVSVAMTKIGSTIDSLRANSAAAAPAITDFVKRVGAVGAQSGITIDQVAALGSTVDALGMRVEMSATALSRMIPAIRNNAFEIGKTIGVSQEHIEQMYKEGRAMEVIIMLLEKMRGMSSEDIEGTLNTGGMADVMKDLNQQGARAGIVFAGLSQNVDELKRQLGVAKTAYEENIAIMNEYNKMNETTAAKWARLKNEFEEMFVSDSAQRSLGWIIDGLRWIVDFISGRVNPALQVLSTIVKGILISWTVFKIGLGEGIFIKAIHGIKSLGQSILLLGMYTKDYIALRWQLVRAHSAEEKAAIKATLAQKGLNKEMMANVWLAVAAAVYYFARKIYDAVTAVDELDQELAKMDAETQAAEKHLNNLVNQFTVAAKKSEEAAKKHHELEEKTKELREEVEKLKAANDGSAEATDRLKEKENELKDAEKQLKQAADESNKANDERLKLIAEINTKYSTYLGYMLSEKTAAEQVASAHRLIVAALKEELKQKGLSRKQEALDRKYEEGIKEYGEDSIKELKALPREVQQRIRDAWNTVQASITSTINEQGHQTFGLSKIKGITNSGKTFRNETDLLNYLQGTLQEIVSREVPTQQYRGGTYVKLGQSLVSLTEYIEDIWGGTAYDDGFGDWAETIIKKEAELEQIRHDSQVESSAAHDVTIQAAVDDISGNMDAITNTIKDNQEFTDDQIRQLAQNVNAVVTDIQKYRNDLENIEIVYGEGNEETLENAVNTLLSTVDEKVRKQVLKVAKQATKKSVDEVNPSDKSVYGSGTTNPTNYKDMTADLLVARRKQMKEYVNAIQTDSDIPEMLSKDPALKKAIEAGMSKDMRTVIEWYNTERLKIQDELHARHLTNTGDWMDPKKQKAAKKQFQNEVKAYLDELDAYYTERNQLIQTARNNDDITEAEAWRRTIKNETEWYNRRAELQKLYAEKSAEVTQAEQDAIFAIIAERTGDDEKFVEKMIGKTVKFANEIEKSGEKGAAVIRKWRGELDLGTEKDYLKSAKAIGKQMKFIEDTLAKERPYDDITKNLQENLEKMGVLAAQYKRINDELLSQGKKAKYSDAEITAQTYDEMAFFLKQAENAWSIDIDELLRRMAQEGMVTTAEEISKSEMLKSAVMGQLRKTFEEVQNAVKKEASQIKKDVDIIWNDETLGPNGMSIKSAYDKAITRLESQQDSVNRANSLINAGAASENVAAKLAMKQIEMQMRMQKAQFDMYHLQAYQKITALQKEAEEHERIAKLLEQQGGLEEAAKERLKATIAMRDKENVRRSLGLTLTEKTKKEEEQIANLKKLQEESQNRLYTSLREWANVLTSGIQGVFEASNTGNAEYYNKRAVLEADGSFLAKSKKTTSTTTSDKGTSTKTTVSTTTPLQDYYIIENAGTSDAKARKESLTELEYLEKQHEIEQHNARMEAWKKLMDDLNAKMNEQITDWINASLQSQSIDINTDALNVNTTAEKANTEAINALTQMLSQKSESSSGPNIDLTNGLNNLGEVLANNAAIGGGGKEQSGGKTPSYGFELYGEGSPGFMPEEWQPQTFDWNTAPAPATAQDWASELTAKAEANDNLTQQLLEQQDRVVKSQQKADKTMATSTQSAFAKMTQAANLYGIAYAAMSNDNMSMAQKFGMVAVQAAGQAAITALTVNMSQTTAQTAAQTPSVLSRAYSELGPIGGPIAFALFTGLLGGLMGMAASKIAKGKSEIAAATGAGNSVASGRLTTGMLTYASGNVDEFTDPDTLTPGRQYNVNANDGKTYRARYMGRNPHTHITNGPEFHLAGEAGREMIIDAGTTRQITMNEREIYRAIQTISSGGRLSYRRRRGHGVGAFAEGNLEEFEEMGTMGDMGTMGGMSAEQMLALQSSLDRQNDLLENLLVNGVKGVFDVYGKGGLVDSYDRGKKTVARYGQKY